MKSFRQFTLFRETIATAYEISTQIDAQRNTLNARRITHVWMTQGAKKIQQTSGANSSAFEWDDNANAHGLFNDR